MDLSLTETFLPMVSLQDSCCLDISFDPSNNMLVYGQQVNSGSTKKILLQSLIPALLNKSLHYPEVVYEEHVQVFNSDDRDLASSGLSYDVLCIPPGLLGVEFIKSHIYNPIILPIVTLSSGNRSFTNARSIVAGWLINQSLNEGKK